MSSQTYDKLKYIAQVVLPALGTLWFAIATIWGIPFIEQVLGTITAVDTFLGALLHAKTKAYNAELDEWVEPSNGIEEDEDVADTTFVAM